MTWPWCSDTFHINDISSAEIGDQQYFSFKRYLRSAAQETVRCVLLASYRVDRRRVQNDLAEVYLHTKASFPVLVLHGDTLRASEDDEDPQALQADSDHEEDADTNENLSPNSSAASFPGEVSYWAVDPQHAGSALNGVHHPKYFLIFTDRGLHVIISTGNMTYAQAVDASWAQCFPRLPADAPADHGSDFGIVLEDFVRKQCLHTVGSQPLHLDVWLQQHAQCRDLRTSFDFSQAQAALVTTVPGRYPLSPLNAQSRQWLYAQAGVDGGLQGRACSRCLADQQQLMTTSPTLSPPIPSSSSSSLRYGSSRVKQLLKQLDPSVQGALGKEDLLLAQPTSISIGINNAFVGRWLEDLMPEDHWDAAAEDDDDDCAQRSERWQLLWPSHDFIEQVCRLNRYNASSSKRGKEDVANMRGMLFLQPRSFALMETDIHTQFAVYEPNPIAPYEQAVHRYSPHFKSYTRMLHSRCIGRACECQDIAWTLMTSACLSRGAQGARVPYSVCTDCKHIKQGYTEYRNFEMGVMFRTSSKRQYKARSADCPLHREDPQSTIRHPEHSRQAVILPIPFKVSGLQAYCDATGHLLQQPFFNDREEAVKYGAMPSSSFARTQSLHLQASQCASSIKMRSFTVSTASSQYACTMGSQYDYDLKAVLMDRSVRSKASSAISQSSTVVAKHGIVRAATLDPLLYCHVKTKFDSADIRSGTQSQLKEEEGEDQMVDIGDFFC